MKKECTSVFFLLTVIISLEFGGCDLLTHNKGPLGESTLHATINGKVDTFTTITSHYYFGLRATGSSKTNILLLYLANGQQGEYVWKVYRNQFMTPDTAAFINSVPAVPNVGGFSITWFNAEQRIVTGNFEFTAVDTIKHDTIAVKNGDFRIYFPYED